MTTRYTKINESVHAKVHGGYLYVRLTGINQGMVVQGERAGAVYRMPYAKSLNEAMAGCGEGWTAIDRALDPNNGELVSTGRLIR